MKIRRLFLFLSLVGLAFGCIIPTRLPALTATAADTEPADTLSDTLTRPPTPVDFSNTPAPTPSLTITPLPAPAETTPIPHPPLAASGPYLAYLNQVEDQVEIVQLDADGSGQKRIPYPADAAPENTWLSLSNVLSPDGQWLAYYSGSAGTCFGEVGPDTADLSLHLMSLADGTTRLVTPLLSDGYPDIFTRAARELGQPNITAEMLQSAFICGIMQSSAWSPDSRYLAFAGQMEGLSSDLYLYDTVANTIKRLSSGPQEVQWVSWSPNGKWVLDGSSYSVGEGMQYNIYATSVDGATIKQLSNGTPSIITSADWLDDHRYFDSNGANGPGSYDLKLVDVNTGKTMEVWNGSYGQYAYIPYGNWVALNANTPIWPYPYDGDFQTGIFLVNLATLEQTRVNSLGAWGCCGYSPIQALGHLQERLFLVKDDASKDIEYLASDGTLTPAGVQTDGFSVSPDRLSWIAITSNLQVFSEEGSLIRTVDLPAGLSGQGIGSILWRQDSSGLFITSMESYNGSARSASQLYALDLAKGSPLLVDTFTSPHNRDFVWVGGSR